MGEESHVTVGLHSDNANRVVPKAPENSNQNAILKQKEGTAALINLSFSIQTLLGKADVGQNQCSTPDKNCVPA